MIELLNQIDSFLEKKDAFAIARVIQTWGSAPRPIGSAMLITADGTMAGSVSGGCVEGAVVKKAMEVLVTKQPQIAQFGVSDDEAWAVGLSCGGAITVFIEPFFAFSNPENWEILKGAILENQGAVLLTKLVNEATAPFLLRGSNWALELDGNNDFFIKIAQKAYRERKTQTVELENNDRWFVHVFPPKPKLVIVGAAHITVDLVHLAHYFGFETVVIDPRGIFAEKTDFPTPPDQLFVDWPAEILPDLTLDAYTFAVMLTHDPKIDDQALHILLNSDVAYIGALGSKKTHEKRVKRLTEAGFTEGVISRIHAPIGVDINAKSAREIALSIIAELVGAKNEFL